MKICLISAPTANDFDNAEIAESDEVRMISEHAPLGILSLAAVLEQKGLSPVIVDLNRLYYDWLRPADGKAQDIDFTEYASRHFAAMSFDIFGFSTICSSYPLTLRIAQAVKKLHRNAVIMLGGPQASVVDVATMQKFPEIDFVVRGEAEHTLPCLIESLSFGSSYAEIPGITYRNGGEVVRNPNAKVIEDLDALPLPAFHLYPHMDSCTYIPLELGRGCPFACTFCSTNDFFRRKFRLKSPARMIDQMKHIKETYRLNNFDLVHDMFTIDHKRVSAFCKALIASGEEFYWGCSARADCISDALIALMHKAGCRGIFLGIEAGSQRLQKTLKKNLNLNDARDRIQCADKHQIKTAVSLITGFPDETMDDLRDTIEFFMDSLRYDYADPQLCLLAPLAKTPIQIDHQDRLIFDDVISDMSFQGWRQDPMDRKMIEAHPDIFPNFYSVPTPFLDRHYLKELRDFILTGMTSFRWLLVGLHQDSGDLLSVFSDWRAWLETKQGGPVGENASMFYSSACFHQHFIEFVRVSYLPNRGKARVALNTLLDYEASFSADKARQSSEKALEPKAEKPALISLESVPAPAPGVKLTHLDADYGRIVRCLRKKAQLKNVRKKRVTLITRDSLNKGSEILQLSPHSAGLLGLCDGSRTVAQIAESLGLGGLRVEGVSDEKSALWGVEVLRKQRLVRLLPQSECA